MDQDNLKYVAIPLTIVIVVGFMFEDIYKKIFNLTQACCTFSTIAVAHPSFYRNVFLVKVH